RVTFYSATRHTCASHLLMGTWGTTWTLAEVGAFLGHSDAEVTQRYAKVQATHLREKAAETTRRDPIRPSRLGHAAKRSSTEKRSRLARERVTGFEPATFSLGNRSECVTGRHRASGLAGFASHGHTRRPTPSRPGGMHGGMHFRTPMAISWTG